MVITAEGASKTRNIRRKTPTEQVNVELAKVVTGLPWSPKDNSKSKDTDTFILPSFTTLATPNLKQHKEQGTGPEGDEAAEIDPNFKEAFAEDLPVTLHEPPSTPRTRTRDEADELQTSPLSRRRLIRFNVNSPKRDLVETELVDVEEAKSKHLRTSCVTEETCLQT